MFASCKKWFCHDAGLCLMRLALGLPFIGHGWQKLSNMDMTIGFFSSLGVPSWLTWVVALVELLGGIAVVLGVCTKWASSALAVVMAAAILITKGNPMGLFGGHELEVILLLLALGLAMAGAGACSADAKMCKGKKGGKDGCGCCDHACDMK